MNHLILDYTRDLYVFRHENGTVDEFPLSRSVENIAITMAAKGWNVVRVHTAAELADVVVPLYLPGQDNVLTEGEDVPVEDSDLLTTKQAAELLGVSGGRVNQFIKTGLIMPHPKRAGRGGGYQIDRAEVERVRALRLTAPSDAPAQSVAETPRIDLSGLHETALVTLGGLVNTLADIAGRIGLQIDDLTTGQILDALVRETATRHVDDRRVTVKVLTDGQVLTWAARDLSATTKGAA